MIKRSITVTNRRKEMSFNPLLATKEIQENYVNFYKTHFAIGNKELSDQLEKLTENNRLWREPFIAINQNYVSGGTLKELQSKINLDDNVVESLPISKMFKHQEDAIINIVNRKRNTVISSGTGSGKTESFLIPVLNECARSQISGIKAIIVYPTNALANDQVDRLRDILYKLNTKRIKAEKREITFGIYTGSTPELRYGKYRRSSGMLSYLSYRCPACKRNASLICSEEGGKTILTCKNEPDVRIKFQIMSREEMRESPPDILITNYVMLERILVRSNDKPLFEGNRVKLLVLDEIHDYGGTRGVDVALLLRRLKRRLLKSSSEEQKIIRIGTSATMSQESDPQKRKEKIMEFATKLFGTEFASDDVFEGQRKNWDLPEKSQTKNVVTLDVPESMEVMTNDEFVGLCKQISTTPIPELGTSVKRSQFLGKILFENHFFQVIITDLIEPRSINELVSTVQQKIPQERFNEPSDNRGIEELIWSFLKAGSLARNPNQDINEPLLKVGVHNFFRILPKIFRCSNPKCRKVYFTPKDVCEGCDKKIEELAVCRNCSEEFFVSNVRLKEITRESSVTEKNKILEKLNQAKRDQNPQTKESQNSLENYRNNPIKRFSSSDSDESLAELWYRVAVEPDIVADINEEDNEACFLNKCLDCGSFNSIQDMKCRAETEQGKICHSSHLIKVETYPPKQYAKHTSWRPRDCPSCGFSYGSGWAVTKFEMGAKLASTSLFNMAYTKIKNHKLLIFSDSRQDAAALSGWMDFAHEDTALKQLIVKKLLEIRHDKRSRISFNELLYDKIIPTVEEWYNGDMESFDRDPKEIIKKVLLAISDKKRLSVERLGMMECRYNGLYNMEEFQENWNLILDNYQFSRQPSDAILEILRQNSDSVNTMSDFVTTILNMMRRYEAVEGLEEREWSEQFQATGFDWDIQNNKIDCKRGTVIHNLASKRKNRFLEYTKKVFSLENSEATFVLESVWNFIRKQRFVVKKNLRKFRKEFSSAYVVTTGKMMLSVPEKIHRCEQCYECFCNIPQNCCSTMIRQKLCRGITVEITYEEFLSSMNDNYYFNLFYHDKPLRMVTKEHTGALSDEEKKSVQDSFSAEDQNERMVDVIVATPTLELGVDIGDLSSVGLYKSPPSSINYIQRVGRAGRRDGIAFINTFFFNSPIDEYYFRNPRELIKGDFYPPYINFENEEVVKRHFYAIVLETVALSNIERMLSIKVKEFIENKNENIAEILNLIEKDDTVVQACKTVYADLPEHAKKFETANGISYFKDLFTDGLNDVLDNFSKELESIQIVIEQYHREGEDEEYDHIKLNKIMKKREELNKKKLINLLYDVNFLPTYAFPGKSVEIEDVKGTVYHGGRPGNIAISEFAPNCEIAWNKRIYKSVGIDSNSQPELFCICNNCKKYYGSKEIIGQECPFCKKPIMDEYRINSIAPTKILIRTESKSITESGKYNEPKLDVYMSKPKQAPDTKSISLKSAGIHLTKYGNTSMLLTVNEVFTESGESEDKTTDKQRNQIQICNKCGKAKEKNSNTRHRPINKKFVGKAYCTGKFEPTSLHHQMNTNVISIKIKNDDEDKFVSDKRTLTTLKSAIIYSGQSIAEAMEGEIEGVIKDDELLLFDNVNGGAGYVDIIFDRIDEVLNRSFYIMRGEEEVYKETCDKGCLRCLWSFRRKRDIPFIDKRLIYPLLENRL